MVLGVAIHVVACVFSVTLCSLVLANAGAIVGVILSFVVNMWMRMEQKRTVEDVAARSLALKDEVIQALECEIERLRKQVQSECALCIICVTRSRNILALSCLHCCLCDQCAALLPYPKYCPVCRRSMRNVVFFTMS